MPQELTTFQQEMSMFSDLKSLTLFLSGFSFLNMCVCVYVYTHTYKSTTTDLSRNVRIVKITLLALKARRHRRKVFEAASR